MSSWWVIGAGYAGIAAARALREAGLDAGVLEAAPGPGGVWNAAEGRAYDSVRLVTSRAGTAYPGRPFPPGVGAFPSGRDFGAYLERAAADLPIRYGAAVRTARPQGSGWSVQLRCGEAVRAAGVVLATGLHHRPVLPVLPGRFAGAALHSARYRGPEQLRGRVLVVGAGNSGLDIAVEAAQAGHPTLLGAQRWPHVLPRSWSGRPVGDLRPAPLPGPLDRWAAGWHLRGASAPARAAGLPAPDHPLLTEAPVLHDAIGPVLRSGALELCAAPVALRGGRVQLADGRCAAVDTIVWATGYLPLPPVARALLDGGRCGPYRLTAGIASPCTPGLLTTGLTAPLGAAGALQASSGRLIARLAVLHGELDPAARAALPGVLARFAVPRARSVTPVGRLLAEQRRLGAALPAVRRLAAVRT